MDKGLDFDEELDQIEVDQKNMEQKKQKVFISGKDTSGGSRKSRQRRVRSSSKDNTKPRQEFKNNDPLNLSDEFSNIDSFKQVDAETQSKK
jgi:hypothetical protein